MKFSIWYNNEESFFDILKEDYFKISSVYFASPSNISYSWRHFIIDSTYIEKIIYLLKTCEGYWIETILLLNSTVDKKDSFSKDSILWLYDFIDTLVNEWLKSITLTNFLYLNILKKKYPDLIFYSSVNCRLKTVEQAIFFKEIWVDILTIDRDINRDVELIKSIRKKTWLKIQLMLNEPCIKNCPYRSTHFNMAAENNDVVFWLEFEELTCFPMYRSERNYIFRIPFIRPEDLVYYEDFVDVYKLVTRDISTDNIKYLLDIYSDKKLDWNLMDIFCWQWDYHYLTHQYIDNNKLNKLNFFEIIKKCPWDCSFCNICDIFFD